MKYSWFITKSRVGTREQAGTRKQSESRVDPSGTKPVPAAGLSWEGRGFSLTTLALGLAWSHFGCKITERKEESPSGPQGTVGCSLQQKPGWVGVGGGEDEGCRPHRINCS